ncbi:homoserine dehydrogenase [Halalkalibacter akibai]|uniref:Homoserine dehydrogenase n=1 Tax=Halalkalibacter akibai (strain ATCC 43226 / DSM 21942 / CIP 109018 / JCM 9157 / 1139) TaxID=1236973 RepID=W4QSN5_HALA3|nr:homoserine dehydrogenase [Halalkalibacter akibai]GAE34643.1 homoserine dehydrogenase [Halalkalibacter akibai JCM 9157]
MPHKLALIGFGGVGQGFVDILEKKKKMLRDKERMDFQVVAITDLNKGSVHHPEGLCLKEVKRAIQENGTLDAYPDQPGLIRGWDSKETIEKSNADSIVEMTFTNVLTGQPAIDHCKWAFQAKKNVVMTNKGPVALAHDVLSKQAEDNGVNWMFEGAVMSGTPALRLPQTTLVGNDITAIQGILNGTTNYMLTRMEKGLSYEDALFEAQKLGYAEADPTADVEGFDVLYKILILARVVLGIPLQREDVTCKGIQNMTLADIEKATKQGKRWKLIGSLIQTEQGLKATVQPEMLDLNDPLAGIQGATNAITYNCDLSGPITLVGAGAGIIETGYAVLIDLINIERKR